MNSPSNQVKDWRKYVVGRSYNNSMKPPYYATIDTNIAFYSGDQWRNVQANGMPTPVFNIIKRAAQYFVATLTSNSVKCIYEPLAYAEDDAGIPLDVQIGPDGKLVLGPDGNPISDMADQKHISDIASNEIDNLFDKWHMENRIRDALFDASILGDVAAHIYFDKNKKPYGGAYNDVKGEICLELVDGSNIMFGNANNPKVEEQPYIVLVGRDMVDNLRNEAMAYKTLNQSEAENITMDKMVDTMAGDAGKIEIIGDDNGKALYIIVYSRDSKTNTIHVSKCVENTYIYEDIDTGLTYYPIAWLPWEKQKNQYHGRALATGMIPNQIFLNRMFAMVMYHLMMASFPKAIYDKTKIAMWSNQIGEAIEVEGLQAGENISNIAAYLNPGNMSNQIVQVIELAYQYTKEALGINDALTGSMRALNYRAIVAMQQAAQVPLENPKANLYEWVSDIGRISLDMMGTYYGSRPIVLKDKQGSQIETFDFAKLKNAWLNVKTDVGASNYWSEVAQIETLDNLLKEGAITVIEYLETLPDGYIADKQELIDSIKQRMDQQQQMQMQQAQAQQQPQQLGIGQILQSMPQEAQQHFFSLPHEEQVKELAEMLGNGGGQS